MTVTSYIATTGAATKARAGDSLVFPYMAVPQPMSVYLRFVEIGAARSTQGDQLFRVGSGNPHLRIESHSSAPGYSAAYNRTTAGGGGRTSRMSTSDVPAYGDRVEILTVLSPSGAIQISQRINEGSIVAGSTTLTQALPSTWKTAQLALGGTPGGTFRALIGVRDVLVMRGVRSMGEMSRYAGTQ